MLPFPHTCVKLKTKPNTRERSRYLLIKGKKEEIEGAILEFLGILGWAKANPRFVFIKGLEKGKIVLTVDRKELDNIRAAFEMSKDKIEVLKVSGTLKGLGVR